MSIALVQSFASTTQNHFSSNTTVGNLLVCVVQSLDLSTNTSSTTINTPTVSGLTWLPLPIGQEEYSYFSGAHYNVGAIAVFYANNAPSVSSGSAISASASQGSVSFRCYEFSGTSGIIDADSAQNNSSNSSVTINPGALTTTITDCILVCAIGAGLSPTYGAGYTEGVVVSDQYILNKSAGSGISTAFGSGSVLWAAQAVAFQTKRPTLASCSGII
jgi:hypothetical protein